MTFFAFGLNHVKAAIETREVFALNAAVLPEFYERLSLSEGSELVVLSTCNRTEVYLLGLPGDVAAVQQALAERAGTSWPADAAFLLQDEEAIRHVLQVTCGLRSQILGDGQILAQVKSAYQAAVDADRVGTVMHRLMHAAFRTAKRVISETGFRSTAVSVSGVAVSMARAHFETLGGSLAGRRALLVGTGEMGRLALDALRPHELAWLGVTNRSRQRADEVAAATSACVVPWEARYEALQDVDIVLVATGAPEPVLLAPEMPVRAEGREAALVIDIAVPRNVDPFVAHLPGYTLLDLDALHLRLDQLDAQRRAAVPAAGALCDEALAELVTWFFHQQALQPAIHAIRNTFEAIRQQEIDRYAHRFAGTDRAELDRLTRSILQKLLAIPVVRLKNADPESIDFVRGIRLLETLFSRPGCEDVSAQMSEPVRHEPEAPAVAAVNPLAPEASALPARCPFDAAAREAQVPPLLQAVLRAARGGDAGQA